MERPEPSLREIFERVERIDVRGATIEARVEDLGGKVTALDGKVEALDGKFTALDGKVEDLRVSADSRGLLLEDMKAQNRLTIEAVEGVREALDRRIDRLEQETRSRDATLELALRDLRLSVQQNSIDIRDLAGGRGPGTARRAGGGHRTATPLSLTG